MPSVMAGSRDNGQACLFLLYARRGLGFDEPRIACVRDEKDVHDVVMRAGSARPEFEVRWESVPWDRAAGNGVPEEGALVHVVSVGAPRNLVGVRGFDTARNAEIFAGRYEEECVVETCRLGEVDWESLRG